MVEKSVKWITNFFTFILAFLRILEFLFSKERVLQFIDTKIPNLISDPYLTVFSNARYIAILLGIFILFWIIRLIIILRKRHKKKKYNLSFGNLFLKYNEFVSNSYNSFSTSKAVDKSFLSNVKLVSTGLCERIVSLLDYNFDDKFSSCIKLIYNPNNNSQSAIDQIQSITLCRAGVRNFSSGVMDLNNPQKVIEHSELSIIIQGEDYSYNKNVKLLKKIKKYKRPDMNIFNKDFYRTSINVPIKSPEGIICGFLCINTKKSLKRKTIYSVIYHLQAFAIDLSDLFFMIKERLDNYQ